MQENLVYVWMFTKLQLEHHQTQHKQLKYN
jgi:hypothetical protein